MGKWVELQGHWRSSSGASEPLQWDWAVLPTSQSSDTEASTFHSLKVQPTDYATHFSHQAKWNHHRIQQYSMAKLKNDQSRPQRACNRLLVLIQPCSEKDKQFCTHVQQTRAESVYHVHNHPLTLPISSTMWQQWQVKLGERSKRSLLFVV